MPFKVSIEETQKQYPEFEILGALTPSEQKAAFKVRDKKGNLLCLKIISPDYQIDRLQRELLALKKIDHPNIARFVEYTFSVDEGGEHHHVIEEYVQGTDLAEHLGPELRWPSEKAVAFFSSLADALGVLRENRIVHRDLKPTNVRIREDGSPVLIDFGLARHLDLPSITPTSVGGRIGTPKYFSPEQFLGTRSDIDHRTDLFALGLLLYEALVGHHPFWQSGMSWDQLCDAVCSSEVCFDDGAFQSLSPAWQGLIHKLLAKQRIHRPMRAEQVARVLEKLGQQS